MSMVPLLMLFVAVAAEPAVPLWERPPFDRVTFTDGKVREIDAVRIPAGTDFKAVADDEYVGQPGLPPRPEIRRTVKYLIHDQTEGDQEVLGRTVRKIDYYEDILLAQAKRDVGLNRFDDSAKLLEAVEKRSPALPGLGEAWVEHFFRHGTRQRLASQWEQSFDSLLKAHQKQASVEKPLELAPPLNELLDDVTDKWIHSLTTRGDYLTARRVVARVEEKYPQGTVAPRIKSELIAESRSLLDAALRSESEKKWTDALTQLESAIAINPSDPEIRTSIERVYQSHGHLRVGVEQLASFFGGPADWSAADIRAAELVHLPMMQSELVRDDFKWTSSLLSAVRRPDEYLNKRAVIELREGLRWPRDGKGVSIVDVQRLIVESCRPESSYYHPALARLVLHMEAEGSRRLTIDFDRPQPRPEAWLAYPLIRLSENSSASGLGPFSLAQRSQATCLYIANPYFAVDGKPLIQKVTESRFSTGNERLVALAENRIDVAADLPPKEWDQAAQISGVRVATFELPTVYVLQFNFNQRVLRDRTLRRAMAIAVNSDRILTSMGLDGNNPSHRTTAPWPFGTVGYDETIKPRVPDVILARTLVAAMEQKYSTLPNLRLVHSPSEVDRIVCQELARDFEAIGLKITLVEFDPAAPVSPLTADLRYSALTVRDPIYDTMTFLTRDNPSLGEHASPWLRQLLVDLVEVPNLSVARELLPKLHRVIFEDVAVLPLWQFQKRIAFSERVNGSPKSPNSTYDKIVDWSVRPGYAPIYWNTETKSATTP